MLSKSKIKWINSLERKKNRDKENVFVAEGVKIVTDLLPFFKCRFLAVTQSEVSDKFSKYTDEIEVISQDEYRKITFQKSPQGVLAVLEMPEYKIDYPKLTMNLSLALEDIQDPGNLGTIIRIADWFGIKDVFCSPHTADIFSPKSIQATMGAIARVRIHYVDLALFLDKIKDKIPVYGTYMNGENIYDLTLSDSGIIIMGNEGNGISAEIEKLITRKIAVPTFPEDSIASESLNVATATAIVAAEFRRRTHSK